MESAPNCSEVCGFTDCGVTLGFGTEEAWKIVQRLCKINSSAGETRLSPPVRAAMWTLLSFGCLQALFFLGFTLRFRSNRIVKMSSPNLNIVTLCGSLFTYSSGFMFGIEERLTLSGNATKALMQARIWILCIGTSLVFGPILGKTWRLYRVFTQRVPDKRVIIRDNQLLALVSGLVMVDVLVLAAWGLTDPVQCIRTFSAAVKVSESRISYSASNLEYCSSLYTDVWIVSFSILKGSLLLYGMYLAGLTNHVSSPPVNQSLTIISGVCTMTASAGLVIPVVRFFHNWPNLIFCLISGGIFICTLCINSFVFIPQLTKWKKFEEESSQTPGRMAKYFSSPSRNVHSIYSEDEMFYLLGENSSMKQLLTEKDAVIESLQEQVNNAKEKLMKLMSMQRKADGTEDVIVPIHFSPDSVTVAQTESSNVQEDPNGASIAAFDQRSHLVQGSPPVNQLEHISLSSKNEHDISRCSSRQVPLSAPSSIPDLVTLQPETVSLSPTLQTTRNEMLANPTMSPIQRSTLDAILASSTCLRDQLASKTHNYVSSDKLQEILQDLSVDAVGLLKSPDGRRKIANHMQERPSAIAQKGLQQYAKSISPYMMRKRRPPFHGMKGVPSPYYFPGSLPPHLGTNQESSENHAEQNSEDLLIPPNATLQECLPSNNDIRRPFSPQDMETGALITDTMEPHNFITLTDTCQARKCRKEPFSKLHSKMTAFEVSKCEEQKMHDAYDYSDSDSSSSDENYCYYHRPYCEACFHGPYESSDSCTSGISDSESEGHQLQPSSVYMKAHPVVNFKDDLKPTFV
ncbi:probable G-protein coupled receptor 156 isoform X1 [Polypterus senegalus]|uniref:probable G-protein coupled receptor 156 isoform X1 n=1 Tax=Polypterus senegalus TaxID=55291 RepID=UPI001962B59B|nr:probable G-protein coupled receptor 156 isoform X1 [Polypterus senegalus]